MAIVGVVVDSCGVLLTTGTGRGLEDVGEMSDEEERGGSVNVGRMIGGDSCCDCCEDDGGGREGPMVTLFVFLSPPLLLLSLLVVVVVPVTAAPLLVATDDSAAAILLFNWANWDMISSGVFAAGEDDDIV